MAEPMMAPAANPPTMPAATPQPRQPACAGDGNAAATIAAAASAMIVRVMGVLSVPKELGTNPAPKAVTPILRADEPGAAPADRVAIGIEGERPACPVAARAFDRVAGAVAFVDHIAGLRPVIARAAVGDGAADDGAGGKAANDAGTHAAAHATGVGGARDAQGSDGDRCRRRHHR